MSETDVDTDWLRARMRELGLSRKALAELFGVSEVEVWRRQTGKHALKVSDLNVWAKALSVPVDVVLQRFGQPAVPIDAPVTGSVGERGKVTQYGPRKQRTIGAPKAGYDLAALDVGFPNRALGVFEGASLFFEPADGILPDAQGRLCVVSLKTGAQVVGVAESVTRGACKVVLWGGSETVTDDIAAATPVRWIRA